MNPLKLLQQQQQRRPRLLFQGLHGRLAIVFISTTRSDPKLRLLPLHTLLTMD